jgi:hypothetical protein
VVINVDEWLQIAKNYGMEQTVSGLDKLFIKRAGDGSCAFLCNLLGSYRCGLQYMKPRACQLWPFKILNVSRYGFPNEASYSFGQCTLFIYADSTCNGIRYGIPTWEFANRTLREFIEIASGVRNIQLRTTGKASISEAWPHLSRFNARRLF